MRLLRPSSSDQGPPPPLGGGIVGLWHMDETAGTTMVDSSGNGNDGVISGATPGREGTAGLAYEFGTQSLVRVPNTMNPGAQDFSVSMWIKFTEPPPSDTRDLIRKGFSNTSGGDFKMEIWPAGNIQCYFRSTTKSVTVKSVGDISDGAWHFVMCRRAGSTFITVVDGTTWTGSGSIGSISNTATLNIGAKNANEDHYVGLMDDVQMTIG
jgi:concanavalin A-like lectin/glucanase superfamily protein